MDPFISHIHNIALILHFAKGGTKVEGAEELRYKESDRIQVIIKNGCKNFHINITETKDGFSIN